MHIVRWHGHGLRPHQWMRRSLPASTCLHSLSIVTSPCADPAVVGSQPQHAGMPARLPSLYAAQVHTMPAGGKPRLLAKHPQQPTLTDLQYLVQVRRKQGFGARLGLCYTLLSDRLAS